MFGLDPIVFGIALVILALILIALFMFILRAVPRYQPLVLPPSSSPASQDISNSDDATLLVQIGGRVLFTNQQAREWFGHLEEEPNLERLARRTRPSDVFLSLCASEGQARFTFDGRYVEGTSYYVPYHYDGSVGAYLVSLRRPQVSAIASGESEVSEQALSIFAELSQAMASSLDLDATLRAILESVEQLIPSDLLEITVWDEDNQHLVPYHFVGIPDVDRELEKIDIRYTAETGYSGYLVTSRQPLLVGDVDAFRDVRPAVDRKQYPFNSYLGAPLLVAGEVVGTLELASLSKGTFTQSDVEVLRILSGQAAVALHNAKLFEEEQRRVLELSGLATLAQAIGNLGDTQDLFARLVEAVTPLLDVSIVGFLMYDELRRTLQAQVPFYGIPADFIELYRVNVPANSPAEEIWLQQETIVSLNAPEDPRLETLGLSHAAQAAGIQNTVVIPLTSAGQMLGYLQVANKKDGTQFNSDDIRLLTIVAGQAATIIENANLVKETQERAQRSESLRRVASLTGSEATLDEILTFSLRELARLLRADIAVAFFVDESRGDLRLHTDSLYGTPENFINRVGRISIGDPDFRTIVTGSQRPFLSDDITLDDELLEFYKRIAEELQVRSVIDVPINVREQGVGEIILGSQTEGFFDRNDLIMMSTIASQLAVAIEKATLYTQTDESLRRRVEQLLALTRISRELNTSLDLTYLLKRVYDELLSTTRASCGTIYIFELSETTSTDLQIQMHIGDEPGEALSLLERNVLERGEPIIVDDYTQPVKEVEIGRVKPPHEGIQASLIVPIAFQENAAGLIHLHAEDEGHFDGTTLEIAQGLASQAAIAFGNAQRYREQIRRTESLNRRVETMTKLLDTSQALSPDQSLDEAMEAIAYGIQESTPFSVVKVSVYDEWQSNLILVAGAGLPLETIEELKEHPQPWSSVQQLLEPQFRFSRSYFVPKDRRPITLPDLHAVTVMSLESDNGAKTTDEFSWHAEDSLLIPLFDGTEQPMGLISVDDPRNGLRPDQPTIEALEIFASQAALAIESRKKLQELSERAEAFEQEVGRAQEAARIAQDHLPTLLHKDVEQTVAIHRLSQQVHRIRAGLDIAEIVSRLTNRIDVLLAFGREFLTRMDMDLVLVAESSPGGPRLLQSLGTLPSSSVNLEALLGQRNPLRSCLRNGEAILVSDVDESEEWKDAPLLQALETGAFMCLPIIVGEEVDASILAVSYAPIPPLTTDDKHLYAMMSRQVAIALENLRLLIETNRRLREVNLLLEFSRQLGTLDLTSILRILVDSALQVIPEAQAGMVAIWQPEQEYLVPQTASGYIGNERILEIKYRSGQALPGRAFESGEALLIDEVDFAKDYDLPPEYLLIYRDATEGRLPLSSMIVPIQTAENKLGVLVLDNFSSTALFTIDDQALIASLTRQTALTLENARLYLAAEQRAVQLQTLTDVAATITSSLQTDELINSLVDQLRSIIPYETGTLWLRQGDRLTIRAAHGFEDSDERIGLSVTIEDSLLLREMIDTSHPIYVGDVREDSRFPSLIEHKYYSWLGVPLLTKGEVIGVIALEKIESNYYTPEHIQVMVTFAGQAAVALENAGLYEDSVRRAAELDERSQRLGVLNRLSTELSGSLDLDYILSIVIRELLRAINCTVVSAVLFDTEGKATLHAEEPQVTANLPTPVPDTPIFEHIRESLGIFSTENVEHEDMLAPLAGFLVERNTRALYILPMAIGDDLLGLLLIHVDQPYRFEMDEMELALTISNQAAVAIQNARLFAETERLFSETQQRSAELGSLFEMGVNISQVLDQQRLIEIIFDNTLQLMGADAVGLVTVAEGETLTLQALDSGEKIGPMNIARAGNSFSEYVIDTGTPILIRDMESERDNFPIQGITIGEPVKSWLGVPLIVRGTIVGVLSIQKYTENAFGEAHQRLLGQIGNQLAAALDNARLFETVQNYAADLEKRVAERTREVENEHHRTQTLLSIITELSTSLDLDLVLNRTLAVLNEAVDAEHSLIMLNRPEDASLQLRVSLGYTIPPPKGGQVASLKPNEGLAGWVLSNRQPALIQDLQEDSRWIKYEEQADLHRSAIAVPLVIGEEILGVLLLYHREPGKFVVHQLELVQATAKQIAVAINNAQLYNLIRDQAERLGDMLRTQHVETSRSQAMLEAVADGVLVTDMNNVITLFNPSAEDILGLEREKVLGRGLENFIGLFGKAAHSWVRTIRTWSEDPSSYEMGDTYAEQIDLDDRRVVSVHLSPVLLRADFLGTVSIFRDITHLIEVDRLKSEFVATVSHELRTPMTSIKGYVEVLLMGAAGDLTGQQVHFLEVVKSNTERLAILVNDLLDISRIEAGRATLSLQPLDMRSVAESSKAIIEQRMKDENRPMEIILEIPEELPSAYGDLERIRQILDNLVENAYQYTPENGRVVISMHQMGEDMQVDVIDNGIGILPEDQPRIFERFYRGEDPLVLATSGTGLGLSIVKHLVDMHKGQMWMESSGIPGEGSKFSFTIPIYDPEIMRVEEDEF